VPGGLATTLGGDGTIVAGLNVGTVSARYSIDKSRIIAGVVRAAATISQRLGCRRTT
jgi:IclR family pca regulon transcriptional regulator